jgi:hypothetical protein
MAMAGPRFFGFATGLAEVGCEIFNEVVLNQVLVSFGTPECSWATTEEDVERSLEVMRRLARG